MFVINATDYAPIDPLTPPCDVNQINIGYVGENHARCLVFDLTECVAQFGEGGFAISFIRHGDYLPYLVTDTDRLENNAIWLINSTDTAVEGYGMVQLQYIVGTTVVKSALYQTVTFASNEIPGNVPDPYEDLLSQIAAYAAQAEGAATTATAAAQTASTAVEEGIKTERSQRIAADNGLQDQITAIRGAVGAPEMASSSTDFVETNKIYVYTGNEPGYTFGNWYYYNGAEWVSGGVYNATAFETDKTLTVEDMAADAKTTGNRINAAFVTETTSGSVCSFDDGADGVPVKDLVVNITAVQSGSGDPSPSNIRPISSYDAANIIVSSENLIAGVESKTLNGVTVTANADGSWTLNGTCTSSAFVILKSNIYLKAGRYTLKCAKTNDPVGEYGSGTRCQLYSDAMLTGLNVKWSFNSDTAASANLPEADDYHIRIRIAVDVSYDNITLYPMLVLGDTAPSTFSKGEQNAYSISFEEAGRVFHGTLDVTSGMLTATAIGYVFDGTENWIRVGNENARIFRFVSPFQTVTTSPERACSHFPNAAITTSTTTIGYLAYSSTGSVNTNMNFRPTNTEDMTLAEWKEWVAGQYANGTPLTAWYEPINPVSYQLDPTTIKSILGQNNIWADCGDITELTYRADTKLYIEHLTTPDGDMVADANIANGSYFMVNNRLYIATAAIASGASIVPGTNCTETNLAAALNAINA